MEEQTLSESKAFSGDLLDVFVDEVKLPSDKVSSREVVSHPGGVVIVPRIDCPQEDKYLLVKQYRYPAEDSLWEFPAGKLDPGETPLECAKRELQEETGYGGGKWEKKLDLFTSPGYSDEVLTLFVVSGVEPLTTEERPEGPDEEFVFSESFASSRLIEMAREEKLKDGKTLAGMFFLISEKYHD